MAYRGAPEPSKKAKLCQAGTNYISAVDVASEFATWQPAANSQNYDGNCGVFVSLPRRTLLRLLKTWCSAAPHKLTRGLTW